MYNSLKTQLQQPKYYYNLKLPNITYKLASPRILYYFGGGTPPPIQALQF